MFRTSERESGINGMPNRAKPVLGLKSVLNCVILVYLCDVLIILMMQ
jgi:hypothetical protein